MEEHSRLWISVLTAIIGLAIVSVILSRSATTVAVIKAAAQGFGGILGVAVSPVTGTAPPSLGPAAAQGGVTNTSAPGPQSGTGFTQNLVPVVTSVAQAAQSIGSFL